MHGKNLRRVRVRRPTRRAFTLRVRAHTRGHGKHRLTVASHAGSRPAGSRGLPSQARDGPPDGLHPGRSPWDRAGRVRHACHRSAFQRTARVGERRVHMREPRQVRGCGGCRGDASRAAAGRPGARVQSGEDGAVRLLDGDAVTAEARPTDIPPRRQRPSAPARRPAPRSTRRSSTRRAHPFPGCFVCGPARAEGMGCGSSRDQSPSGMSSPRPGHRTRALADTDGHLPRELVWAALDCPTSIPVANDPDDPDFRPIVLARLAARILEPVRPRAARTRSCPGRSDSTAANATPGRHYTAEDGELLAISRALWIELKPPAGG